MQESDAPRQRVNQGPHHDSGGLIMKLFGWSIGEKAKGKNEQQGPKWLDAYAGQSTDELIALRGEYRTDSLVVAFEEAVMQKAARLGAGALSMEENAILRVEALERDVN